MNISSLKEQHILIESQLPECYYFSTTVEETKKEMDKRIQQAKKEIICGVIFSTTCAAFFVATILAHSPIQYVVAALGTVGSGIGSVCQFKKSKNSREIADSKKQDLECIPFLDQEKEICFDLSKLLKNNNDLQPVDLDPFIEKLEKLLSILIKSKENTIPYIYMRTGIEDLVKKLKQFQNFTADEKELGELIYTLRGITTENEIPKGMLC